MTTPHWPPEKPGAEAMFRGPKGDKGDPGMTRGARHAFLFLTVLMFLLAAAALIIGVRQVNGLNVQQAAIRSEVLAQCQFDADIGTAPITVSPATGQASKLGVAIIADARQAWRGLGCPGDLPPATPSLIKWAKHFHLPYR